MNFLDTPNLRVLSGYLDVAARRQGIIAENLANIDTPNYRTRDLDFRAAMRDALEGGVTAHSIREVPGLLARPDGNNVSLDREGLLLAQTQLQFRTGVQLLRAEFRKLQIAIQEGRQG